MRFEFLLVIALSASVAAQSQTPLDVTLVNEIPPDMAGASNQFGRDVATDGSRIVVGELFGEGVVDDTGVLSIFERVGGSFVLTTRLFAQDGFADNWFGLGLAIDGDTLLVGASQRWLPGEYGGAAYVFREQPGGTWALEHQWVAPPAPGLAASFTDAIGFGTGVALDGDRAVIGAPSWPANSSRFGAVYVYERSGTHWALRQTLTPTDPLDSERFGASVDLDGDRFVVGAGGSFSGGRAYVYELIGSTWTQVALFEGAAQGDKFGFDVAIDGDRVLVGANESAESGVTRSGAVHVYRRDATAWVEETRLFANDATGFDRFGWSVSLSANRAVIGAPQDGGFSSNSPATEVSFGSVYVFERDENGWGAGVKLRRDPGLFDEPDDHGVAVALEGDLLAVGARLGAQAGEDDAGSAFAYEIEQQTGDTLCFGNGGDDPGCMACPCGNDAPAHSRGGCLNASSWSAMLQRTGSRSLAAQELRFRVHGAQPDSFGILISGASALPQTGAACPVGSGVTSSALNGLRCVTNGVLRHGTRSVNSEGWNHVAWGAPSTPQLYSFSPGEQRVFQVFYREPEGSVCSASLNTSNALAITFEP